MRNDDIKIIVNLVWKHYVRTGAGSVPEILILCSKLILSILDELKFCGPNNKYSNALGALIDIVMVASSVYRLGTHPPYTIKVGIRDFF